MTQENACLGICLFDPDTGICQGCGRGPEEISGQPIPAMSESTRKKFEPMPQTASQYPLPPQVAEQAGESND